MTQLEFLQDHQKDFSHHLRGVLPGKRGGERGRGRVFREK